MVQLKNERKPSKGTVFLFWRKSRAGTPDYWNTDNVKTGD